MVVFGLTGHKLVFGVIITYLDGGCFVLLTQLTFKACPSHKLSFKSHVHSVNKILSPANIIYFL